jgi:hypothetical protein
MNPPPYDLHDGYPDMDSIYTRCPSCGIVAPAGSVSFGRTDEDAVDPDEPLLLACIPAAHRYTVTTSAFLARDAVRVCRCGTAVPCPAEADQIVCTSCHLQQPGPFLDLDPDRRDYVHRVHRDYLRNVRSQLRRLRDDEVS